MKQVLLIARTELKRNLESPISLVFLGGFLVSSYLAFFNQGRFFARNIADLRPLFDNLPLLMIWVVSALAMRGWAEEQQRGQSEHLFSLPVPIHHWVMGRFYGGMGLISIALLGTLPLVLTVALTGHLDWGPVICGYFGALLLGSAYLALGLALSAATAHQMVALMGTAFIGGLLYIIGTETVTSLVNASTAEWLQAVGTSSRFESLAKGVLNLSDILYFGLLTAFFLLCNVLLLLQRPHDIDAPTGRRLFAQLLGLGSVALLNILLFVGWTQGLNGGQIDLTDDRLHSLNPTSQQIVADLADPITIRGLFSDQNHAKLAPFIPRIKDTLMAFQRAAGPNLTVRFDDPMADLAIQQEVAEVYGIVSRPIRVTEVHKKTIVNAYFAVLLEQGSKHIVLSMEDLLVKRPTPLGVEFELGNTEYTIARALQKLNRDAIPLEDALSRLSEPVRLTVWKTAALIPNNLRPNLELFQQIGREFVQSYPGKFVFENLEFDGSENLANLLNDKYGIAPVAVQSAPNNPFYLHLLVEVSDNNHIAIQPRSTLEAYEIRSKVEDAIRSSHPAYSKHVTLLTDMNPGESRARDYIQLENRLRKEYQVNVEDADNLGLRPDTDVLLIAKPGDLATSSMSKIQSYLNGGGTVIALYGAHEVRLNRNGLKAYAASGNLARMLKQWGLDIQNNIVLGDAQNATFAMPIIEREGGRLNQSVQEVDYPLFPEVRPTQAADTHPTLTAVAPITTPWASPFTFENTLNLQETVLLASSLDTQTQSIDQLTPDRKEYPSTGFPEGERVGSQVLAAIYEGRFSNTASASGKLIFIPSSEFASDFILDLAEQVSGESHGGNIHFILNLIDWATEQNALIQLRRSGLYQRKLANLSVRTTRRIEWANYLAGLCFLSMLILWPRWRRARQEKSRGAA